MSRILLFLMAALLSIGFAARPARAEEKARPLALHSDNPRYFLFRGKPAILIASGEHYGAVLNRDFDYLPYLDELKARGLNLTRTFSGSYFEVPSSFGIEHNTLAPGPGRALTPWARGDRPGAAGGGNKFDLMKWDEEYFQRLTDFVTQAGKRGVVVELVLFCPLYDDNLWKVSPFNAANNVNGIGKVARDKVFALQDKALTEVQLAFARKLVRHLRDFDNIYFEVCNEPYFGGVTIPWQERIIDAIVEAEQDLPHKHLIAQNIANGAVRVDRPDGRVSIFNFHYATPPRAVELNYHLARPIGDDETGFRGQADRPYRTEAWEFLIAGGAVFSHLDYSYTCEHPGGTYPFKKSPGGGGPAFRRQMSILKTFLERFDFVRMKPANSLLRKHTITPEPVQPGQKPGPAPAVCLLAEPGEQYAGYVRDGLAAELTLELPAGTYRIEWLNPRTGKLEREATVKHPGGEHVLSSPAFTEDLAFRIKKVK